MCALQKNRLKEYHVVPSMHDRDVHFLFCPGGHEKKFGISEGGQVIEYKGSPLFRAELEFIKQHFGI